MDNNTTCCITRRSFRRVRVSSAAEIIYGTTLRLPGEFLHKYIVDAHTDLDNYSDKLSVAMSCLRLCAPRDSPQYNIFQYKEIYTCSHVFLHRVKPAHLQRNCVKRKIIQIIQKILRQLEGHRLSNRIPT